MSSAAQAGNFAFASALRHHLGTDRLRIRQFDEIAYLQVAHPLLRIRVLDRDQVGLSVGTAKRGVAPQATRRKRVLRIRR